MDQISTKLKNIALIGVIATAFASCQKDEAKPNIRAAVDYTKLTATTPYASTFVNTDGQSTVDFTAGNNRYKIFQAINTYAGTATSTTIDATVLKNMLSGTGTPFTGTFVSLNGSGAQLRNAIASSYSAAEAETVRTKIEADLATMASISASNGVTASKGTAGKVGTRMVDARGMETAQIIQKSLIGAFQLDYIGNVLLNTGLSADNYTLVSGKKYTQLEQNWDEAYASLTLNPIYLQDATDAAKSTTAPESFLGSYVWEYNKANYAKIYSAFLKGRAAIANNDQAELKTQATYIRTQFEFAIASAAVGYLTKWGTRTTDADRVHDIGEGGGFLYSLRFCKLNGADAAFSDAIIAGLLTTTGGSWDITPAKIDAAALAIKTKFKLP
jgi:hypothetical protein